MYLPNILSSLKSNIAIITMIVYLLHLCLHRSDNRTTVFLVKYEFQSHRSPIYCKICIQQWENGVIISHQGALWSVYILIVMLKCWRSVLFVIPDQAQLFKA